MRVLSLCFVMFLSIICSEVVVAQEDLRIQKGRQIDKLILADGYAKSLFAQRLGHISALAITEDGTLFAADTQSGRIFSISDRGLDGRADIRRALPETFDTPAALAVDKGQLFVGDRIGVWTFDIEGRKVLVAPLTHAGITGDMFLLPEDSDHILVGYSTATQGRVVRLNRVTGKAALAYEFAGRLRALTSLEWNGGSPVAHIYGESDGKAFFTTGFQAKRIVDNITPVASAFMSNENEAELWSSNMVQASFISDAGSFSVRALPPGYFIGRGTDVTLLDGFKSRRSAWGRPGALAIDKRGLFVADSVNGDVWLVRPVPAPVASNPMEGASDVKAEDRDDDKSDDDKKDDSQSE